MPYITKPERNNFDDELSKIAANITTPGQLNYCITKLLHKYINMYGLSYSHLNECIGVLDAAKMEFNRRVVAPYEDKKIKENGDISLTDAPMRKMSNTSNLFKRIIYKHMR